MRRDNPPRCRQPAKNPYHSNTHAELAKFPAFRKDGYNIEIYIRVRTAQNRPKPERQCERDGNGPEAVSLDGLVVWVFGTRRLGRGHLTSLSTMLRLRYYIMWPRRWCGFWLR